MKRLHIATLSAVGALVLIAAIYGASELYPAGTALAEGPAFEAVTAEVESGKTVRIEARLKGVAPASGAADIKLTSKRIDMGPDGMATMDAPLKQLPSPEPGVLAFETRLAMAGRWALTLSAQVPGHAGPVNGMVIYTAVDSSPKPSATDVSGAPRKIVYYRNPMGLADVSPTPKKDSMGMDYIPVYEDEVSGPAGSVQISLEKVQMAGVRTEKVGRRILGRNVLASGTVEPDEARVWVTSARFSGFVEKLHVATTGATVRKGDPLMRLWIENGDLLRKQADYLSALKSAPGGDRDSALARAKRNLETFGFPREAMEELERTREPTRTITMKSHADGVVLEKPALEGMRFDTGHMHFKIADLSSVWVIAEVAERDLGSIREGQHARLRFNAYPEERFEGRVVFIYPELNMQARSARVRIVLSNPQGRIKIGLYADVEIVATASDAPVLALPEQAIIDSGRRRVALVARGGGKFEPRDVTLGARGEGYVEVREGLEEGEEVVVNGTFLIDAESNLRAALSAFTAGAATGPMPDEPAVAGPMPDAPSEKTAATPADK